MSTEHHAIDEYIRANRDQYTREAITQQLQEAGHAPEDIRAAWDRADGAGPTDGPAWRPGLTTFLVLAAVGAVGAALVWMDNPYGGSGLAVMIYLAILLPTYGIAKGASVLIDRGRGWIAGILLLLIALAGAALGFSNASPFIGLLVVVAAGVPALALVSSRLGSQWAGWISAALPILVWLGITGTCYAPLLDRVGSA
jgi:hypothetical protein